MNDKRKWMIAFDGNEGVHTAVRLLQKKVEQLDTSMDWFNAMIEQTRWYEM